MKKRKIKLIAAIMAGILLAVALSGWILFLQIDTVLERML